MIGRAATMVAATVALLACPAAWAGERTGSPRAALEALPWSDATRLERTPQLVRQIALEQLARSRRELVREQPFDHDIDARRAAAHRLSGDEAAALLAMFEARSSDPVDLARPIAELVRSPRTELERELAQLADGVAAGRSSCGDRGCVRAVEERARQARAVLLARHLESAAARWDLLHEKLRVALLSRQRLADRVATGTSDPYVLVQAKGLLESSWRTVAELAEEMEREAALRAQLASR
jgi:hypothetical protein